MRMLLVVAVLTAAVTLAAGAAEAQTPSQDFAIGEGGTGVDYTDELWFGSTAVSGPSGENPSGHAFLRQFDVSASQGDVTCLKVSGNRALIGFGPFPSSEDPDSFPSLGTIMIVVDGGPAGSGLDTFTSTGGVFGERFRTCELTPGQPIRPAQPLLWGDIAIHDAQALPTAKDQCKNGGWRDFGVFKNQGDCVSFVATKGKNPPG